MSTKGIRLNNPGNIEKGQKWQGLADVQADDRFCTFSDPEYGIRAIGKILLTYQTKYKVNTIEAAITRWAPPNENPTAAYIAAVAKGTGIAAKAVIDFNNRDTLYKTIRAIARQENGKDADLIPEGTYHIGVDLALHS